MQSMRIPFEPKRKFGEILEYISNCMSLAVNIGNLWRFPYALYSNKGGAFLIPYVCCYVIVGLPMLLLNFGVGQFSGTTTVELWTNLAPGWKGIGITQCILGLVVLNYYSLNIAIALRYACNSWATQFGWGTCEAHMEEVCAPLYPSEYEKGKFTFGENLSSSAEVYLAHHVLHSDSEYAGSGIGKLSFELCFYLAFVWLCNYIYIVLGVSKCSKSAYITGLLPVVLFLILACEVGYLPGASEGLNFLIMPTLDTFSMDIWMAALMQCYISLSIACGALTLFSANVCFRHNFIMTLSIILCIDIAISILSSMIVFSVLGQISSLTRLEIDNVIKQYKFWTPYIAYTAGCVYIDTAPSVFSFTFFVTIFLVGIVDMSSMMQVIIYNLSQFKCMGRYQQNCLLTFTTFTCALTSLPSASPEGTLFATVLDFCGNTFGRGIIIPMQIIALVYVYGMKKWCWDYELMINKALPYYYRWCWAVFIPIFLACIYIGSIFSPKHVFTMPGLNDKSRYLFYALLGILLLPIPSVLIYQFFYNRGAGLKMAIVRTFTSDFWWPVDTESANLATLQRGQKMRRDMHLQKVAQETKEKHHFRSLLESFP